MTRVHNDHRQFVFLQDGVETPYPVLAPCRQLSFRETAEAVRKSEQRQKIMQKRVLRRTALSLDSASDAVNGNTNRDASLDT